FSAFEGTAASRLARFDSSGVFSTDFNSGLGTGGVNGDVEALAYDSSLKALYAGGSFTQVGMTNSNRIAKLHTTEDAPVAPDLPAFYLGNLFTDFSSGTGFNGTVRALAKKPSGSGIYVGGEFTTYNSNAYARLVKLNSNGSVDPTIDMGNGFALTRGGNATVNALLTNGSSIFVGGEFDTFKDEPVSRVVKLDTAGELDTSFDVASGPNQTVNALALRGSDLFVGGQFTAYSGNSSAQRLARLDATTGALKTDDLYNVNGTVRALGVDVNGRVYVGGSFTIVNGTSTGPLARILLSNDFDTSFGAVGTVYLNANLAAGIYTLLPFATADATPINMLLSGGLFSTFKFLSSPSTYLWESP
ncbi:MAG: delta-60 repeat domain-containing protein, partial [Silvanigrellaceae bacterium]